MSDVKQITTDDLRHMDGQEDLVLLGCFEDPQVWIDGINDLLTEAGILLDGSTFDAKNVFLFEHGSISNLLFSFEGVNLDMGRLAMWRLQTHDHFGGTWLSDCYYSQPMSEQAGEERKKRLKKGRKGSRIGKRRNAGSERNGKQLYENILSGL